MSSKRDSLLPQARELFARGLEQGQVAKLIGVGTDTLRAWRQHDEREGTSWQSEREAHDRRQPRSILRQLHQHLGNLVAQGPPPPDELGAEEGLYERRLFRLTQTIARFRAGGPEVMSSLLALERLAEWAIENRSQAEVTTLAAIMKAYTDALKSDAETLLA